MTDAAGLIRATRLAHGLTQAQLAIRAGTTQSAIARLESGGVSPTVATADRVLRLLGVRLTLATEKDDFGVDRSLIRSALAQPPGTRLSRGIEHSRMVLRNRGAARPSHG